MGNLCFWDATCTRAGLFSKLADPLLELLLELFIRLQMNYVVAKAGMAATSKPQQMPCHTPLLQSWGSLITPFSAQWVSSSSAQLAFHFKSVRHVKWGKKWPRSTEGQCFSGDLLGCRLCVSRCICTQRQLRSLAAVAGFAVEGESSGLCLDGQHPLTKDLGVCEQSVALYCATLRSLV